MRESRLRWFGHVQHIPLMGIGNTEGYERVWCIWRPGIDLRGMTEEEYVADPK